MKKYSRVVVVARTIRIVPVKKLLRSKVRAAITNWDFFGKLGDGCNEMFSEGAL